MFLGRCGACGSRLVERKNRTTANVFYGCASYPNCRQTYPIDTSFTEDGDPMPEWDNGEVTHEDMGLDDIGDRR